MIRRRWLESSRSRSWRPCLVLTVALAALLPPSAARAVPFTEAFELERCTWSSKGDQNPYFSLQPGYQLVLEGEEDDEGEVVEIFVRITVLHQKERITFTTPSGEELTVVARVVEEREFEDGEIVEVSRNWYARCVETGAIYYFGEEVDDYEDGELVSHGGAWRAGVDGALPGIMMPGTFLLGAKYYQEIAPGVALDRAKHVAMGLEVPTPAGTFQNCVGLMESNPLDEGPGDGKVYCPGVGIVIDGLITLIDYGRGLEDGGDGEDEE